MNCNDMKELLIAYVYDDISQKERLQLDKHLARCQKCRSELQDFEESVLFCACWQDQPVSKNLIQNTFLSTKPEILTPEDLARYLRIPLEDILKNLEDIPHIKIGRMVRFRRASIQKWLNAIELKPIEKKVSLTSEWLVSENRVSKLFN